MSYESNRNQFIQRASSLKLKQGGMYKYNKYKESGQYFLVDSVFTQHQYFQGLKWLNDLFETCSKSSHTWAVTWEQISFDKSEVL